MFGPKISGPKRFRSKKIGVQENFVSKNIWCKIIWVPKKFLVRKIFGNKKFVSNKMLVQKNVCLKFEQLGPKSKVKIGSITAELLPIWTNVTRANFAGTNVPVTVDIY